MAQFRKLLSENRRLGEFRWKFIIKAVGTLALLGILWRTLQNQQLGVADVVQATLRHVREGEAIWLFCLLLLVPVNWALESFKWKLLVDKVHPIPFPAAVKSTLAGLLSGLVLPAQVGDVVGRVTALAIPGRSKAVGAAFISGGIQFYAAVFAGLAGVYYLWDRVLWSRQLLSWITVLLWGVVLVGFLVFFFRKRLIRQIPDRGMGRRIRSALEVISIYHNGELLIAFLVGMARYVVYLAQSMAGVLLFSFDLSVPEMAGCLAIVLMVKTVFPALNLLGDLGLRGISAVMVFGAFGIPADQVLAVTILIWITNILIPALAGLVMFWRPGFREADDGGVARR